MADKETTIAELQAKVVKFRTDRKWSRSPKDLAITISVEANELLELFQFDKWQETDVKADMRNELADVIITCLEFTSERGIDISEAVQAKLGRMERKFPLEVFGKGKATQAYHRIRRQYRQNKS